MTDEITVFVHDFMDKTHTLVVRPWDTIDTIAKRIGVNMKLLHFFNGMILIGAFTFGFYKLTNGDHIYSIPIGHCFTQNLIKKFRPINVKTEKSENESVREHSDSCRIDSFVRETARLKDQFFQKLEGTVACNRKLFSKLLSLRKEEPKVDKIPTVLPPKSETPSIGELPMLWSNSEKDKAKPKTPTSTISEPEPLIE